MGVGCYAFMAKDLFVLKNYLEKEQKYSTNKKSKEEEEEKQSKETYKITGKLQVQ
jgi:hypothetical protein